MLKSSFFQHCLKIHSHTHVYNRNTMCTSPHSWTIPFDPLPTTLSLGVVEEVLPGQTDHKGKSWTEGHIRADLWHVDEHLVPCGLKPQPILLIWWLYDLIVQGGLG